MLKEPTTLDPLDWARFNEAMACAAAEELGIELPELTLEAISIEVEEMPAPLHDLQLVINRAVSELDGMGEKSARIGRQLLTGLHRFLAETGR